MPSDLRATWSETLQVGGLVHWGARGPTRRGHGPSTWGNGAGISHLGLPILSSVGKGVRGDGDRDDNGCVEHKEDEIRCWEKGVVGGGQRSKRGR